MVKNVFGKKVVASNGEFFGRVKDVIVSKGKVSGVIVKNKSREVFIDIICINDIFTYSLMLKINPAFRVIGMIVYDAVGKKIGKVIDVEQTLGFTNVIDTIIVKKGVFSKPLQIKYSIVASDIKNILLKKEM